MTTTTYNMDKMRQQQMSIELVKISLLQTQIQQA